MAYASDSLIAFIQLLGTLPYLPSRHFYRLADHFLMMKQDDFIEFLDRLKELRQLLIKCSVCDGWKEKDQDCYWCGKSRDQFSLCVVESWIDAYALERSRLFGGVYHVLGGALSPLEGITADTLSFERCIERVQNNVFEEIIVATNQTPEGEATASYLTRRLQRAGVTIKITHLASGVPVGTSLEFVDRLTLGKALANRRTLS